MPDWALTSTVVQRNGEKIIIRLHINNRSDYAYFYQVQGRPDTKNPDYIKIATNWKPAFFRRIYASNTHKSGLGCSRLYNHIKDRTWGYFQPFPEDDTQWISYTYVEASYHSLLCDKGWRSPSPGGLDASDWTTTSTPSGSRTTPKSRDIGTGTPTTQHGRKHNNNKRTALPPLPLLPPDELVATLHTRKYNQPRRPLLLHHPAKRPLRLHHPSRRPLLLHHLHGLLPVTKRITTVSHPNIFVTREPGQIHCRITGYPVCEVVLSRFQN
jgi:hypothetical protein